MIRPSYLVETETMNPEQLRALAELVREFRLLLAVLFAAAIWLLRAWPL